MCRLLSVLLIMAIIVAIAIIVGKRLNRPKRIMREGKLLKSEMVSRDGEMFYVEKIAFKDWHVSLHNFYLISDTIPEDSNRMTVTPIYEIIKCISCFP